jgi:hypothetical protein
VSKKQGGGNREQGIEKQDAVKVWEVAGRKHGILVGQIPPWETDDARYADEATVLY